jgi:hypothetical protein
MCDRRGGGGVRRSKRKDDIVYRTSQHLLSVSILKCFDKTFKIVQRFHRLTTQGECVFIYGVCNGPVSKFMYHQMS